MRQIRTSVFETNSSMTHSIVMCPTDQYNDWIKGDTMYNEYRNPQFLKKEDAIKYNTEILKKWYEATVVKEDENNDDYMYFDAETLEMLTLENIEKYSKGEFLLEDFYIESYEIREALYYNYEMWEDNICEYYETFSDEYETPGGESVTAFGYYGHD